MKDKIYYDNHGFPCYGWKTREEIEKLGPVNVLKKIDNENNNKRISEELGEVSETD
jgi:hypothetical protein